MYARVMTPLKGGSLMSKFIAAVFTCAFAFVITAWHFGPRNSLPRCRLKQNPIS
jgi:hypothetical protein